MLFQQILSNTTARIGSTMNAFAARPMAQGSSILSATMGAFRSSFETTQMRFVTYGNTYQPSQLVRKRRHGFLARLASKNGRRILTRRRIKNRSNLSH